MVDRELVFLGKRITLTVDAGGIRKVSVSGEAEPEALELQPVARPGVETVTSFLNGIAALQPSQGACGIGKFVCWNRSIARQLKETLSTIRLYLARRDPPRPLNVLISAPPGSGKSFLVKQMIAECRSKGGPDLEFVEMNISNTDSREDLFQAFEEIRTSAVERRVPFVLFDEVDAKAPYDVYSALLMPMFDGKYSARARSRALGPGVFFFVASSLREQPKGPVAETGGVPTTNRDAASWLRDQHSGLVALAEANVIPKFADFYTRIDSFAFLPPPTVAHAFEDSCNVMLKGVRLEIPATVLDDLYFAVLKIMSHFPAVREIERAALAALLFRQYSSFRQFDRDIFLASTPTGETTFRLEHLADAVRSSGALAHIAQGHLRILALEQTDPLCPTRTEEDVA